MFARHLTAPLMITLLAGHVAAESDNGPIVPYEVDSHTLHLWHLDESSPPLADAADPPTPLLGLHNGASAGQEALPTFGSSISFHHNAGGTPGTPDFKGAILLAASNLEYGPNDNVSPSFKFTGPEGAFTFEALVNLDIMPEDADGIGLGIISMEGEADDRVFNFRIEKDGFLSFIPLTRIGAAGGALATIPTTGPHAMVANQWFHVAVTYNGREGEANNLKLYWTRLRQGLRSANRIGQGTLPIDLNPTTGDFAIGNEARTFKDNAEADPFPGRIDEVRISSIARHPTDFVFVPKSLRLPPREGANDAPTDDKGPISLELSRILVDGIPTDRPTDGSLLKLPPGLHRLDFDYELLSKTPGSPVRIRSKLKGLDENWQVNGQGMLLIVELMDSTDTVLTRTEFSAIGSSTGWQTSLDDSDYVPRTEAVFVPAGANSIRLTLSSGAPDTTGLLAIDDLDVLAQNESGDLRSFWFNQSFTEGESMSSSGGRPTGWQRTGNNPAIARLTIETTSPSLALVDTDSANEGAWTAVAPLPKRRKTDSLLMLRWRETYNVIGGSLHRATYVNVPSGAYTFQALAPSEDGQSVASLSVPFLISPPFWESPWFWPLIAASGVSVIASFIYAAARRRARRRLRELQMQKLLVDDRARIARDMHDDLGTRITLLTMKSALIERDMDSDPKRVRTHIEQLNSSSRNLVHAMDDLVWAVDPANDTLNHLGIFIARTVEEMFRDSPIRCRFNIPPVLPELTLSSNFRHHIALAVKECLHNILRHAGNCEASLDLKWEHEILTIQITDNGRGFDQSSPDLGNGLSNMVKRLEEIHGTCLITSEPAAGTTVTMKCPCAAEKP